jgi:superfamily II DNA/RNA helicase
LRGVKQFRLKVPNAKKIDFLKEIYISLETSQTMVFVNTKKEAENLKESLAK